jgi:AcrR family transcriptional regulator
MPQPDRVFDGTALTGTGGPRQRLLDCAAQLFREKGYERTTVRDIGAAVGIQSGSIFHHFSSKEDILKAVMSEALSILLESFAPPLSRQTVLRPVCALVYTANCSLR